MRPLIILLALLIGLPTGVELCVAGNVTGMGYHNLSIIAPDCNVTGNNNSWLVECEDNARIPVCCT